MHLGHFFKRLGRGVESVFGIARQKAAPSDPSAQAASASPTEPATPTAATGNAGDAVVNYTTMKNPTQQQLQQQAQNPNPSGIPIGH